MKFLVDVNASGSTAKWLRDLQHDVIEVGEKNPRMPDEEILRWAVKEGRIVVTTDNDFEEMIWRRGLQHCGVLRLENLPRAERKDLLQDTLDRYYTELETGAIVVASSTKIRIRRPVF